MQGEPSIDQSHPRPIRNNPDNDDADSQYGRSSSYSRSFKARSQLSRNYDGKGKERAWSRKSSTLEKAGKTVGTSYIQRLPVEGLGYIFARLHPEALKGCMLVCREWLSIVSEDATWRAAFLCHFGLSGSLEEVPGKRLAPSSWREEFTVRYELAQKWARSKIPTVTHDPRIGNISLINADLALRMIGSGPSKKKTGTPASNAHGSAPSMLSLSIPRGTASQSDPLNGKVAKRGFIHGAPDAPLLAGLGGNLDLVTCAAISKDGGTIVWGMANGSVHVSRTALGSRTVHGQGHRAATPNQLSLHHENHMGLITAIRMQGNSEVVATTATDGQVKIWDCNAGYLWGSGEAMLSEGGRTEEGAKLAVVSSTRSANIVLLACGTKTGVVHIWKIDTKVWTTLSSARIPQQDLGAGLNRPVAFLEVDASSSAVLIAYAGGSCFYRVDALDRLETRQCTFGHIEGFISCITALSVDFEAGTRACRPAGQETAITSINGPVRVHPPSGEAATGPVSDLGKLAYVVAGDDQGRTFVWRWDSRQEHAKMIRPIRQLQGFECKVTAIEITDLVILLGTADGIVRTFDLLSGRLVRIFNESSAPRHALRHLSAGQADQEEEAKWSVSNIQASRDGFVASIGARVLAWRTGDDKKGKAKGPRAGGRLSSRAERYRSELELKQDIRESASTLSNEQADRLARHKDMQKAQAVAGIPKSLGDMTEEEALAFAMMLSQEEEEQRRVQQSVENSLLDETFEDDLEHLRLEEETYSDAGEDAESYISNGSSQAYDGRRASSSQDASLQGSPYLHPAMASPLLSSLRSTNILQLSSPDQRQLLQSPSSGSPPSLPDFTEASTWPLPSPAAPLAISPPPLPVSSPAAGPAHTPTPSKWSEIARKSGPSGTPPPPRSLLAAQLRKAAGGNQVESDDMDADLRFALELSRAEEESRREQSISM